MKRLLLNIMAITVCLAALGGCQSQNLKTIRELTPDEITRVNQAFEQIIPSDNPDDEFMINPVCHFFTSYYETSQDIALNELIWYFAGEELSSDNTLDVAEFEALKKLENFPFREVATLSDMPVPIQRKSAQSVEDAFQKYMGISLSDLTNKSDVLYLEEYHAFYTYTSDAGAGFFNCNGGETDGGVIKLFSDYATLTLQKKDGKYIIVSHTKVE